MCLQEKETNNPQQFTEPAKASGTLSNEQGTMQALFKKKKKKKPNTGSVFSNGTFGTFTEIQ